MHVPNHRFSVLVLLAATVLISACGDNIVYRDRPAFEDPPEAAAGFLGYSSVSDGQTVCGNCHIGTQRDWEGTAHADAWGALEDLGEADNAVCSACHSVSSLGNVAIDPNVGYESTRHARYEDVQCESCHGPGLEHVLNPDGSPPPLAPLSVGVDLTLGCGECHSGEHAPFVEEWAASRHANFDDHRLSSSCVACHDARGILESWGVRSAFIEMDGLPTDTLTVTCAVCHDPHDATNPGQLRFAADDPDPERNLCMKCHHKRAVPEVGNTRGPHSPQGPLLLGEAGWFPPNFIFPPGAITGSHSPAGNPGMCATCHVNRYEVTDSLTGDFVFRSTGHSFDPTPCVDAQGIPTGSDDCPVQERSYRACTQCHLTEDGARFALVTARERLAGLSEDIESMLPLIPASEFSITDNRISTGEGARFNRDLALQPGSPAHNPFLVESLLHATIRQIELDYGLTPSPRRSEAAEPGRR